MPYIIANRHAWLLSVAVVSMKTEAYMMEKVFRI